jgi:hypothetical protein
MASIGHNQPLKAKPLTDSMLHVLELAKRGRSLDPPLVNGKGSQSATAGRARTILHLQRRGLLDQEERLTPAGLAAVDRVPT